MKNVVVKYYSGPEIPAETFLSSGCSMQEVVIKHLGEELAVEETKGCSGWKIFYYNNRAPKVKYFDRFGRLYSLDEEFKEHRYKAKKSMNIDEIIQQNKKPFIPEYSEFNTTPGLYIHEFHHYNNEGLITKEECFNREQKLEYRTLYFYNDLNQVVRTESTDFDEGLYGYTEKFLYDEEGLQIRSETIDNGQTISLSEVTFQDKKHPATVNIYRKDNFVESNTIFKKLSSNLKNVFREIKDLDPLENEYVNAGYRIILWQELDADNTIALVKKYFYKSNGYLIAEEHFRGGISKTYLDKIYVNYYNESSNLRTREYYRASRENLKPEYFGTEYFFYDSQRRLIRTYKKVNPFGEYENEKIYVYDKDGLLIEKRDTDINHTTLYFYNKNAEKIRAETYYRKAKNPRVIERWWYDKEGRIIEREYFSVRIMS